MRLALLGHDEESLAILRWVTSVGSQELVAAYDAEAVETELLAFAPQVRLGESWEALVLGSVADAVIVGRRGPGLGDATGVSDAERRTEQLRKLAQAAVPMIVVCPACEAIVGFEIEMIRRDTRGVIVPYSPGANHPATSRVVELISQGDSSPLGKVEQIALDR